MRSVLLLTALTLTGCQHLLDKTDKQVYALIEQRQAEALGIEADSRIGRGDASVRPDGSAYAFVPDRQPPEIPDSFALQTTTQPTADSSEQFDGNEHPNPATSPTTHSSTQSLQPRPLRVALDDCMRYAFRNSSEFQNVKESLYLTALALTLERHLWTPRWVATLDAKYDYVRDFDRAMSAVAQVAVEQKLPYGGEIVARVVDTFVRDIGNHETLTESAEASLEVNLPLLRGAGRTAYESRYQAERDLVYAIRDFERFRRTFSVDIASFFFNLIESRQRLINAQSSEESNRENYRRAKAMFDAGRASALDVQRAKQDELRANNLVLGSEESHLSLLDQFKVILGMPLEQPLEVIEEEDVSVQLAPVPEQQATEVAVRSRLDLMSLLDQIDDAKRKTKVARNGLLPDLDLSGRVSLVTEPDILDFTLTENNRTEWQGSAFLSLPLDRKREVNNYRQSVIALRRASRNYQLEVLRVRQQVRRALRQMEEARLSLKIQAMGMKLAEIRKDYAQLAFQEGLLGNRDVIEAENDLLDARNNYAAAQAQLRVSMLKFRLDTGTLRVNDEGIFLEEIATALDHRRAVHAAQGQSQ